MFDDINIFHYELLLWKDYPALLQKSTNYEVKKLYQEQMEIFFDVNIT